MPPAEGGGMEISMINEISSLLEAAEENGAEIIDIIRQI